MFFNISFEPEVPNFIIVNFDLFSFMAYTFIE